MIHLLREELPWHWRLRINFKPGKGCTKYIVVSNEPTGPHALDEYGLRSQAVEI